MFPPLITRTTFFGRVFHLLDSKAASGAAPAPSATTRFRSINMRIAEAISSSSTVTISSTFLWMMGKVISPTFRSAIPSANVGFTFTSTISFFFREMKADGALTD